jgi:NitT/TauT family transport system substrate-binding protein
MRAARDPVTARATLGLARLALALALALALPLALAPAAPRWGAAAAEEKPDRVVFGLPGNPPIFGAVIALVAERQGFWKKHGLDATLRFFDSGAAAARGVAAGDVDVSLSPTPLVVNQVSNSDVKLVAIYGLEHPDFFLASTDPAVAACRDVAGREVGVESIGGARSLALKEMIATCGLKLDDVKQVPLAGQVDQAMIAGQLKVGVLHLDDIPGIEAQMKRPAKVLVTLSEASPLSHYLVVIASRDRLAKDRARFVKTVAGLVEAQAFMKDPAHAKRVAEIATATGRSPADAERALQRFLAMEFWPDGHAGLHPDNLRSVIEKQVAIGGIRPGQKPVTVEQLADPSVFRDALALTKPR